MTTPIIKPKAANLAPEFLGALRDVVSIIEIWRVRHSATTSSNCVVFFGIGYTNYTQGGAFCLVWRCSARFDDFFLGLVTLLMNAVAATFACRMYHITTLKDIFC